MNYPMPPETNGNPEDIKRMLERLHLCDGSVGLDFREMNGIYHCFIVDMETRQLFGPVGHTERP